MERIPYYSVRESLKTRWRVSGEVTVEEETVQYRRLGNTGLSVSNLCLGTMEFGRWIDEAASARILDAAIDDGINILDTANFYGVGQDTPEMIGTGDSEEILGRALRGRRNRMLIETKFGCRMGPGANEWGFSRQHIMDEVENQLRRLQTDHIDIYQVHYRDRTFPIPEIMRALDDLVRQGKVRYIGCDDFAAWEVAKANGYAERLGLEQFWSVQTQYNLLLRAAEQELIPFCLSEGLGVFVYAPYAKGMLAGVYENLTDVPAGSRAAHGEPLFLRNFFTQANIDRVQQYRAIAREVGRTTAQLTLSWILNRPGVTTALIGASQVEHVEDAAAISEWTWDVELMERVTAI